MLLITEEPEEDVEEDPATKDLNARLASRDMRSVFFNNTHTHTQKEKESRERMSFESEFCVSYAQKRGRQKKKHTLKMHLI